MSYVPDPSTRDTPLNLEEVEELARRNGAPIAKGRAAGHFVSRVLATIRMYQEMMNKLHREVSVMQTKRSMEGGMPTTLAARDAVKYLSPDERASLCDETTRQYLDRLGRTAEELEGTRGELSRTVNSLRLAAATIAEDPSVPEELRIRFQELLTRVPDPAQLAALDAGATAGAARAAEMVGGPAAAPPEPPQPAPLPTTPPAMPTTGPTMATTSPGLPTEYPAFPTQSPAVPTEPPAAPGPVGFDDLFGDAPAPAADPSPFGALPTGLGDGTAAPAQPPPASFDGWGSLPPAEPPTPAPAPHEPAGDDGLGDLFDEPGPTSR